MPFYLQYLYYTFSPKYILNKILSIISIQIIQFHALFLQGYSLCNPAIDVDIENNAHVPYAFRMGLISDELFQVLLFQTFVVLFFLSNIRNFFLW